MREMHTTRDGRRIPIRDMERRVKMDMRKVIDEVKSTAIHARNGDDEYAHRAEKKAWEMALAAIEAGAPNARELAKEALKTKSIEFARWYA